MPTAALVFIGIFWAMMIIPCVGVGWLGWKLITDLGTYPSKTPAIQMGVMFKLVMLEVVSMTILLLFFKVLVAE